MRVERSAPRRVASPPLFIVPHGLLSVHSHVTMPPDDLWLYIRRYRYDTLTTADDRGHAAARLGARHPAGLSALRRATSRVHRQITRPGHGRGLSPILSRSPQAARLLPFHRDSCHRSFQVPLRAHPPAPLAAPRPVSSACGPD